MYFRNYGCRERRSINVYKCRFRGCFDKQYGKRAQALWKSASEHPCHIHWSLARKFYSRKSLLLTCLILRLLVNTLVADEKYPVLNRENLTIPIQMQLSQKRKIFSQFSAGFFKSRLNFKHFEEKDHPQRFCIFKITDSKNSVR